MSTGKFHDNGDTKHQIKKSTSKSHYYVPINKQCHHVKKEDNALATNHNIKHFLLSTLFLLYWMFNYNFKGNHYSKPLNITGVNQGFKEEKQLNIANLKNIKEPIMDSTLMLILNNR